MSLFLKSVFYTLALDLCVSNPCENDGTCVNGVGAYTCRCATGFTGANCETS